MESLPPPPTPLFCCSCVHRYSYGYGWEGERDEVNSLFTAGGEGEGVVRKTKGIH